MAEFLYARVSRVEIGISTMEPNNESNLRVILLHVWRTSSLLSTILESNSLSLSL